MRKRRKRFTWMPLLGTIPTLATANDGARLTGRVFTIDVFNAAGSNPGEQGGINTLILPVVPDRPVEPEDGQTDLQGTLATMLAGEWFCERIVGSLFVGLQLPDTGQNLINNCIVAAGFFVARANDDSSGGGSGQPIGSATIAERNSNYSPLHVDASREPWMWRKLWMLGGAPTVGNGFSLNPTTNAFYGSIADGPKVDVKSVRRIGQDDRLWFAISTCCIKQSSVEEQNGRIDGYLDVRILGNTRKAKVTGVF